MLNTLNENNIVLIDKKNNNYHSGDIVVFKDINKNLVVKRIIGKPNDTILCYDDDVYINNNIIKEIYVIGRTSTFSKVILSRNEYFVMGDNRENSLDSRNYGPIQKEQIIGKVIKVF